MTSSAFLERFKGQISSVNKRGEIDLSAAKPAIARGRSAAPKQRVLDSPKATSGETQQNSAGPKTPALGEFQPYTLKEYTLIQDPPKQLGGLGPSYVGTEDWVKRKKQQEKLQDYARVVQLKNKQLPRAPPRTAQAPTRSSARDRALEFSKRIPKPLPMKPQPERSLLEPERPVLTSLDELEAKHQAYQKAIAQIRLQMQV